LVRSLVEPLRRVLAIAAMISRRGLRAWYSYAASAIVNLWLMTMLTVFGLKRIALHVLVGASIYTLFSSCIASIVYDAYYSVTRLKELLLVSPLTRIEFLLGISLGHMIAAATMCIPYIALLSYLHPTPALAPMYLFTALSSWIVATSIGYLIPCRDPFAVGPRASLVASILTLLPPVYYPPTLAPAWLRPWLALVPTYDIATIAKNMIGLEQSTPTELALCTALLAIEAATLLALAIRREERLLER